MQTQKKIALLLEAQKKMRVLLELAKKNEGTPQTVVKHCHLLDEITLLHRGVPSFFFAKKMRVLPRQLPNTAIYWMKSLCCIEEYPHFFLQVRGVPLFFFAS